MLAEDKYASSRGTNSKTSRRGGEKREKKIKNKKIERGYLLEWTKKTMTPESAFCVCFFCFFSFNFRTRYFPRAPMCTHTHAQGKSLSKALLTLNPFPSHGGIIIIKSILLYQNTYLKHLRITPVFQFLSPFIQFRAMVDARDINPVRQNYAL